MKRLFLLALVAVVAWYGWKQLPKLLERRPSHEVVVQNDTGREVTRVRVVVDGQTFVRETLPDGEAAHFLFRVGRDASFELTWRDSDQGAERQWSGGLVTPGPLVQRHTMALDPDGGVMYRAAAR